MKTKTTLLLTVAIYLLVGISTASALPGAKKDFADKLTKKLSLTDEQAAEVRSILEGAKEKYDCKAEETKEAVHVCLKERKADTDTQITALLNSEQKVKFAKLQDKHRKYHSFGKKKDKAADAAP